ncbi:MAG TPA: ATP-binding cassette domain-containing protein, partial [Puia sp.]|nr:ATP-binding cassette domain-containing protein [Puia sp.]
HSATCFEVVSSGLFDTIGLFRHLTNAQEQKVLFWLKLLELETVKSKRLSQLSLGQQRRSLLARALIKTPPLLILDEPCQGLDEGQTLYFRDFINQVCVAFNTTLVYVSHYPHQIPQCVNHFLELKDGAEQKIKNYEF